MSDEVTLLPGCRVGGYLLEEKIASGASGMLWRARGDVLVEARALKLLTPFRSPIEYQKFYREVFALSRLNHPNITRISDMGIWHNQGARHPFVVMEYVEGETLNELANKRVSWRVWKTIISDLLQALSHSHALGIVHRDIKPGNVLVALDHQGERIAKLVDFGIARVLRSDALDNVNVTHQQSLSRGMRVSGTPRYMAPEQIDGKLGAVGPWTDLYALGCMIWRLLCLQGPFEGDIYRMLSAHLRSPLPPFEPVIGVPEQLELWLRWLLDKAPYKRCANARQALKVLEVLGPAQSTNKTRISQSVSSSVQEETEKKMMRVSIEQIERMALLERWSKARQRGQDRVVEGLMTVPVHWDSEIIRVPQQLQQPLIHPIIWRYSAKPLVGRRRERDIFWGELRQVQEGKAPRWVVLSGAVGVGRRHLQQWFCRHVKEIGCAEVVMIDGDVADQEDGVVRDALRQLAFLQGVHPRVMTNVLSHWLAQGLGMGARDCERELSALTALFGLPEVSSDVSGKHRLQSGSRLLSRLLAQLAQGRRLVIAMRRLERHPELVHQMRAFFELARQQGLEVMIVEVASKLQVTRGVVSFEVMREERVRLELAPLPEMLQQRALNSLIALDPVSSQVLIERTSHDLSLAKMHLHKWVHQGLFANHETSLDLILPSDVLQYVAHTHEEFWETLFTELREDHEDPRIWFGLEVAALMQQPIRVDVWRECCKHLESNAQVLLDRLIAMGFVRMLEGAWRWKHECAPGLLRRDVMRQGRLQSHHRILAQSYESVCGDQDMDRMLQRASEHWIQAEELVHGMNAALRSGELALTKGNLSLVQEVLSLFDRMTLLDSSCRELGLFYKTYLATLLARAEGEHEKARELAQVVRHLASVSTDPVIKEKVSGLDAT